MVSRYTTLSHPCGRTLGQPVRQASALVREEGMCHLVKKARKKEVRLSICPSVPLFVTSLPNGHRII